MSKWILAAGAAALALTAPVLAGPGKGGDHDGGPKAQGGGGGGPQAQGRGGGGPKEARGGGGGAMRVEHGGGAMRVEHGGGARQAERQVMRVEHGGKSAQRQVTHLQHRDTRPAKAEHRTAQRLEKQQAHTVRTADRDVRRRDDVRNERVRESGDVRLRDDDRRFAASNFRGFTDDCPPGLAKKGNGCLPPGQAKKLLGAALPASLASQMLQGPYSQWYRDDDRYYYRNDGDYIYRVDRDGGLINALFPFQDRDYSYYPVGMAYPSDYDSYNVPYQYQSFYPDGNDYNYRYGDGAIYQVSRSNNAIESIVALLAGDLGVGQTMPTDYGVYNVPMAYRDRYYDTPDAMYRYNDGYIYQADPKTQLITAVIDALV